MLSLTDDLNGPMMNLSRYPLDFRERRNDKSNPGRADGICINGCSRAGAIIILPYKAFRATGCWHTGLFSAFTWPKYLARRDGSCRAAA